MSRSGSALLALFLTAPLSCAHHLIQADEVISFLNADGSLREPERARVIRAPQYARIVGVLADQVAPVYRIYSAATLGIQIPGTEVSINTSVRQDGVIDLPILGEIIVEGRTYADVKEELKRRYSEYYVKPQIVMSVAYPGYLRQEVIIDDVVIGKVYVYSVGGEAMFAPLPASGNTGGKCPLQKGDRLTAVVSGVLGGRANLKQVVVFRRGQRGYNLIILSDMDRFFREGAFEEDLALEPNDLVFVPKKGNTWAENLIANVRLFNTLFSDFDQARDNVESETKD
jgi:protein involved in polysaccharide export with SLBB domain